MTENKNFIITDAGVRVAVQPISLVALELSEKGLLQSYKDRGEPLECPTYEIELPGGQKETVPHNETTLRTDEEKVAYYAHLDALRRMDNDLAELRQSIIYSDGIPAQPEDDAWEARQRRRFIRIPEDPEEKRVHWITTELLKTANDIVEATTAIMALSSGGIVSREEIDAHKATFLASIQSAKTAQPDAAVEVAGQAGDQG